MCYNYLHESSNLMIWINLCLDNDILWDIIVRWGKDSEIYVVDSSIYCNVDSAAVFNDACFNLALTLSERLMKEYEFEEEVYEID